MLIKLILLLDVILSKLLEFFVKSYNSNKTAKYRNKDEIKFDLILICGPKDVHNIGAVCSSWKKHSNAAKIYVVSPRSIHDALPNSVYPIDERDLTSTNPLDIGNLIDGYDRSILGKDMSNWFFQQFLKLNTYKIECLSEYYVISDADHYLLNDQSFYYNNKPIVKYSDENHFLYKITTKQILGFQMYYSLGLVCHHFSCLKSKNINLVNELQAKFGRDWEYAIIELSKRNKLRFSEYDLLANYYLKKSRNRPVYWFNLNVKKGEQNLNIKSKYISVTRHVYSK